MVDFFISHASEDKQGLVKKLADNLIINGANVFYDEYSIKLGDSIYDSINKGLAVSKHAIIILSKYFFEKGWTNSELQAIFNKSIAGNYKILLVYHGITHDDVKLKYPLLADNKAIESSVGVEKITEELFNAVGMTFKINYIKNDFDRARDIKDGFSVSMMVGFPNRVNLGNQKTLFEIGDPNIEHSRLKLILWRYERFFFEVTDSMYRKYAVSVGFDKWVGADSHFIVANLDMKAKILSLFVDDDVKDEIRVPDIIIDDKYLSKGYGILGCSLNLSDPCPFLISYHSIGGFIPNVPDYYRIIKKYMDSFQNIPTV